MMTGHVSIAMSGIQSHAATLNARFALQDRIHLMKYIGRQRICLLMQHQLRDGGKIITHIRKKAGSDMRNLGKNDL